MQVISKGKYKRAFDLYSKELTGEQRQMVESVTADLFRQMVSDIGEGRGIPISKIKEIADGRIFSAEEAKQLSLIDEIGYFSDAAKLGGEILGSKDEARIITREKIVDEYEESYLVPWPYKVAVIEIDGDIITGRSGTNWLFGGRATGADTVTEALRKASDDIQIRAIILRINSPGGSAVAAGQIYEEIKKVREKGKIVVSSLGDVAASGGYFVGVGADKIIADPSTITGSIGVIGAVPHLSELYKKIGIKVEMIKEGKHADMFSGIRKLTTEEVKSLENLMDETYREFIRVVAEGRKMSTGEVEKIAEGRIYTGIQAADLKLIDKLGGFSDAVETVKELTKIKIEPRLVYYREGGFFSQVGFGLGEFLGLKDLIKGTSSLVEYKFNY